MEQQKSQQGSKALQLQMESSAARNNAANQGEQKQNPQQSMMQEQELGATIIDTTRPINQSQCIHQSGHHMQETAGEQRLSQLQQRLSQLQQDFAEVAGLLCGATNVQQSPDAQEIMMKKQAEIANCLSEIEVARLTQKDESNAGQGRGRAQQSDDDSACRKNAADFHLGAMVESAGLKDILFWLGSENSEGIMTLLERHGADWFTEHIEKGFRVSSEFRQPIVDRKISDMSSKFAEIVAAAVPSAVNVANTVDLKHAQTVQLIVDDIGRQIRWTGELKTLFEDALRAYIAEVAVALTIVRGDGHKLKDLEENMKNNQLVCVVAVQSPSSLPTRTPLQFAGEDMQKDREVVMAAAKHLGRATLNFLRGAGITPPYYREVVMAAVQNDGCALSAAGDMKNDQAVVLAAVQNNPYALDDAGKDMQNDEEVVKAALRPFIPGSPGWKDILGFAGDAVNTEAIIKELGLL